MSNLEAFIPLSPREIALDIVARIAGEHHMPVEMILGYCRTRDVVAARNAAIVAVIEAFPHWSYPQVGKFFRRDHTTIIHSVRKVGAWKPRSTGVRYSAAMNEAAPHPAIKESETRA